MSPQPLQPPEHNDPAAPHKRHASPASPSVTDPDEARKRVRFAHDMDDVVLVSSDNQRFPFSSRLLLASSPRWQALLPSLSPLLPSADPPAPVTRPLPEVAHPESGETLAYLLHFLEPAPAHTRALSFPRDWELMRALERYSLWRGIDTMHAAFSQHPLPTALLAPAFTFSQLFSLPSLERDVARAARRRCLADPGAARDVAEGLERGVEETGCDARRVFKLLSYLLHLTSTLSSIRLRALECLRAFDAPYDCEHSCRGMTYAHLVDAFGTASRRRLRRLDNGQAAGDSDRDAPGANSDGHAGGVDFDCKDCSMRWEKVVGTLLEGMDELPECPF